MKLIKATKLLIGGGCLILASIGHAQKFSEQPEAIQQKVERLRTGELEPAAVSQEERPIIIQQLKSEITDKKPRYFNRSDKDIMLLVELGDAGTIAEYVEVIRSGSVWEIWTSQRYLSRINKPEYVKALSELTYLHANTVYVSNGEFDVMDRPFQAALSIILILRKNENHVFPDDVQEWAARIAPQFALSNDPVAALTAVRVWVDVNRPALESYQLEQLQVVDDSMFKAKEHLFKPIPATRSSDKLTPAVSQN